ncbi:efflux RND transporter periplasmic adaptor subunit [Neobacillus terrae]|uniref:efflux RND transporter periplasmic adaptor subunit n=1 Tax=Neobacillus terrae TaxID=3034837 RepID=UPI001407C490|nr:efflux RND transporter periplasmic adaptor subunit [Neobacillus terrae]NHM32614.1 efflux RND transporter periplasmic adaptor subunit [Neobacillus terrae]
MKKWIFIIVVILIIGYGGYKYYASKSSNNQQQTMIQNRTTNVQKGKFEVKVSGTGTIQPVTSEDIKSAINNNEIDEVLVSAGESVKSGEELITFTDGSDPITAPADGVITTIAVSNGERVQSGQVVAHLTNYNFLKTIASIDELDIPKVQAGQPATIKVNALPDQTFTGKVTAIANEGTSTNGVSSFDVTVSIDNPKNLKVGMSTETSILTASKNDALYVPLDAVHTVNGQKFVMLAAENPDQTQSNNQGTGQNFSRNRVMVKTGLANEDYVEITQGLTEGQTVRLPNLASSSTSGQFGSGRGMMFGGMGGMNRSGFGGGMGNRNRSGGGNSGGRSGN